MRILVLQHIACEPPAEYENVLSERDVELVRIELDEGEALPDRRDFDAVIAMGGPMDTGEVELHPWLTAEKRLIAELVEAETPFWGVCLGAQLLADALGAKVYRGPAAEIGVLPLFLTEAAARDPITTGLPRTLPAFHWHSCGLNDSTRGHGRSTTRAAAIRAANAFACRIGATRHPAHCESRCAAPRPNPLPQAGEGGDMPATVAEANSPFLPPSDEGTCRRQWPQQAPLSACVRWRDVSTPVAAASSPFRLRQLKERVDASGRSKLPFPPASVEGTCRRLWPQPAPSPACGRGLG